MHTDEDLKDSNFDYPQNMAMFMHLKHCIYGSTYHSIVEIDGRGNARQ